MITLIRWRNNEILLASYDLELYGDKRAFINLINNFFQNFIETPHHTHKGEEPVS